MKDEVYIRLSNFRKILSKKLKTEDYLIFDNECIEELCEKRPKSVEELNDISGLFPHIIKKFGKDIIKLINIDKNVVKPVIKQEESDFFDMLKKKYGFIGFIHSTDFSNFKNIMLDNMLYCRNTVKADCGYVDTALPSVMSHTSDFVQNSVRLYWRVKTPTYYRNEGIKPKECLVGEYEAHVPNPVIFVFNKDIYNHSGVKFSPINAGYTDVILYDNVDKFDFDATFHEGPMAEEDKNYIKSHRNAELLYPQRLSLKYVDKIVFRSKADFDRAVLYFGRDDRFCVDNSLFNNNWLHIDYYNVKKVGDKILMNIKYFSGYEFSKRGYTPNVFNQTLKILDRKNNIVITNKLDSNSLDFDLTINNNLNYRTMCYYIDNIECIRVKIND